MNANIFRDVGIVCTVILGLATIVNYLLYRGQKHVSQNWQEIAEKWERECRQWRERDFKQRLQIAALVRKYKGLDLEKGEEQ